MGGQSGCSVAWNEYFPRISESSFETNGMGGVNHWHEDVRELSTFILPGSLEPGGMNDGELRYSPFTPYSKLFHYLARYDIGEGGSIDV